MKCKNCGAELEAEKSVCPACGAENAAPKKKLNLSTGKLAALICAAVVVLAVLGGVIYHVVRMDNVTYKSNYTA